MKNIFINDVAVSVPDEIATISDLLRWRDIPEQGTAVALNDHLITASRREVTRITNADRITVISAAFGG